MLTIQTTGRFRKDIVLQKKRGFDIDKLEKVISTLVSGRSLEQKYRNHKLTGVYAERWECHIEPDWLLIYRVTKTELFLERTGSHSDLF